MSAGTRSSAITATAPASSAIFACSALTTSMITPPFSISAIPRLTRVVPVLSLMLRGYCRLRHRLLPDHPHPLADGHGGRDRQRPQGDVHQHRQVEDRS